MQISDRIRVSDLRVSISESNMENDHKDVLLTMIDRIDMFIQDLISQLKSQPQIFTVDPSVYPDAVRGAKTGDIAVFENQYGDVEIVRFK